VFGDLNDRNSDVARLLKQNKVVQVVHSRSNTKPNIYYLNRTAPTNWPVKAQIPTSIQMWSKIVNPALWALVGLNALGVLVMLGRQLITPEVETSGENRKGRNDEA
jgi:hypothetical protein